MKQQSLHAALTIFTLSLLTAVGLGQDFQKSYALAAGKQVSIKNVAGDILVKSYSGSEIIVKGYKEGEGRDRTSVLDFSTADKVDIQVDYPQQCNCDARLRFEVFVPQQTNYDYRSISSTGGNIIVDEITGTLQADTLAGYVSINNFAGAITASSFSGNVFITQGANRFSGRRQAIRRGPLAEASSAGRRENQFRAEAVAQNSIIAKSISGSVLIDLTRLENLTGNQFEFSSISGNVIARLPETLSAKIQMSTVVGNLTTDFPIAVTANILIPGKAAQGIVGDGAQDVKISSVVGNVVLLKN